MKISFYLFFILTSCLPFNIISLENENHIDKNVFYFIYFIVFFILSIIILLLSKHYKSKIKCAKV